MYNFLNSKQCLKSTTPLQQIISLLLSQQSYFAKSQGAILFILIISFPELSIEEIDTSIHKPFKWQSVCTAFDNSPYIFHFTLFPLIIIFHKTAPNSGFYPYFFLAKYHKQHLHNSEYLKNSEQLYSIIPTAAVCCTACTSFPLTMHSALSSSNKVYCNIQKSHVIVTIPSTATKNNQPAIPHVSLPFLQYRES